MLEMFIKNYREKNSETDRERILLQMDKFIYNKFKMEVRSIVFNNFEGLASIISFNKDNKDLFNKKVQEKVLRFEKDQNSFNVLIIDKKIFTSYTERQVTSIILHELGHLEKNIDRKLENYIKSKYFDSTFKTILCAVSLPIAVFVIHNDYSLQKEILADSLASKFGYSKDLQEVLTIFKNEIPTKNSVMTRIFNIERLFNEILLTKELRARIETLNEDVFIFF
jgi:hypothetical protein